MISSTPRFEQAGAVEWSIIRHVKDEKIGSSHKASRVNDPFFTTGVMKPTKLLSFFKMKQVNEFIRVKTVIISFRNKKITFVVFYVKAISKSVP